MGRGSGEDGGGRRGGGRVRGAAEQDHVGERREDQDRKGYHAGLSAPFIAVRRLQWCRLCDCSARCLFGCLGGGAFRSSIRLNNPNVPRMIAGRWHAEASYTKYVHIIARRRTEAFFRWFRQGVGGVESRLKMLISSSWLSSS